MHATGRWRSVRWRESWNRNARKRSWTKRLSSSSVVCPRRRRAARSAISKRGSLISRCLTDAGSAGALPAVCCRHFAAWDVYLDLKHDRYFCVATGDTTQGRTRRVIAAATVVQPEAFVLPLHDLGLQNWCPSRARRRRDWGRLSAAALHVSLALRFSSMSRVL